MEQKEIEKWEYKVLYNPSEKEIAAEGMDGWEAYNVTRDQWGISHYFKRRVNNNKVLQIETEQEREDSNKELARCHERHADAMLDCMLDLCGGDMLLLQSLMHDDD